MNRFTTGEALHVAAAMLNMEVHPSYSAMRKAKKDKSKKSIKVNPDEIAIVPNPASTYFRIKGNDDIDVVEIISVEGKSLRRYSKTAGQEFSIKELINGIYIIKLTRKNGEITYHKLNKQDR